MDETSYVIVFPTIFSKNKIPQLISNIKKNSQNKKSAIQICKTRWRNYFS